MSTDIIDVAYENRDGKLIVHHCPNWRVGPFSFVLKNEWWGIGSRLFYLCLFAFTIAEQTDCMNESSLSEDEGSKCYGCKGGWSYYITLFGFTLLIEYKR